MTNASVMASDQKLIFDTNLAIEEDFQRSDFSSVDLWAPGNPRPSEKGKLFYKSRHKAGKFDAFDYFPGTGGLAVVSERLKAVFERVCVENEMGIYPCEILFADSSMGAWVVYPLVSAWVVDKEKSHIDWLESKLKPEEVRIRNSDNIVFKNNCLGQLNLARFREAESYILVSDTLRKNIEDLNSIGIKFFTDNQLVFRERRIAWPDKIPS